MPPKIKYSREDIVDAAYEIAREKGIGAVVARDVAKKLGCTVSPIFTAFSNMDELKRELFNKAKAECLRYLQESLDYTPSFKEFGLRWIDFGIREPNIYRLIFANPYDDVSMPNDLIEEFGSILDPLFEEIRENFGLDDDDTRELFNQMTIYANGITTFIINDTGEFTAEDVSRSLSEVYLGLVYILKKKKGKLDSDIEDDFLTGMNEMPEKK